MPRPKKKIKLTWTELRHQRNALARFELYIPMLQLKQHMDALGKEEVRKTVDSLTADWEYPLGRPKDEVIEKAIRMYLATVKICEEKKFDTSMFGLLYKVRYHSHLPFPSQYM